MTAKVIRVLGPAVVPARLRRGCTGRTGWPACVGTIRHSNGGAAPRPRAAAESLPSDQRRKAYGTDDPAAAQRPRLRPQVRQGRRPARSIPARPGRWSSRSCAPASRGPNGTRATSPSRSSRASTSAGLGMHVVRSREREIFLDMAVASKDPLAASNLETLIEFKPQPQRRLEDQLRGASRQPAAGPGCAVSERTYHNRSRCSILSTRWRRMSHRSMATFCRH